MILVLLALIVATIVLFWRISKPAGILLVPYVCWVCIATALNTMILVLN
jgi:tryptophan-rich sensory protein